MMPGLQNYKTTMLCLLRYATGEGYNTTRVGLICLESVRGSHGISRMPLERLLLLVRFRLCLALGVLPIHFLISTAASRGLTW